MKGGIIGVDNHPTTSVASGIWRIDEVFKYRDEGTWPGQLKAIEVVWTGNAQEVTSYTFPSAALEDDVIFIFGGGDYGTPVIPTGYTQVALDTGSAPSAMIAYKVMGATPDTQIASITLGTRRGLVVMCVRNVNTTTPLDVTTTSDLGSTGMTNAPSITPINDNCMLLAVGFLDDDNITVTAPSGYSMEDQVYATTTGYTVMVASKLQTTKAASDPAAFGGTGNDQWLAYQLALRHKDATDPISLTYYANDMQTTDGTSFTHTSMNIGTATDDRLVVVCVGAESLTSYTPSITGVTIGGSAATLVESQTGNGVTVAGTTCAIYSLLVTSGTTATVVASYDTTMRRGFCAVYTIINYASATAEDTDTDQSKGDGTSSGIVSVLDGDVVIAVAVQANQGSFTWSNVTEDYDIQPESFCSASGGSIEITSDNASYTVTGTCTETAQDQTFCVATWR